MSTNLSKSRALLIGLVPVVLLVLLSCSASADPVVSTASAEGELKAVTTGVLALMIENKLAAIPNPVSGATAPCKTGTQVMTAYPDTGSAAGSADKLRSPEGNVYRGPDGDKGGYVLRGHDLTGDNSKNELVYYLDYDRTQYCYTVSADGAVAQFAQDGAALTAIASASEMVSTPTPGAPTPSPTQSGETFYPLTEDSVRDLLTAEEVASALPVSIMEPVVLAVDIAEVRAVTLSFEPGEGTVVLTVRELPTPDLAREDLKDTLGPTRVSRMVPARLLNPGDLIGELAYSYSGGGAARVFFLRGNKVVLVAAFGLADDVVSRTGVEELARLVDSRLTGSIPTAAPGPTATPEPTTTFMPTPTPEPAGAPVFEDERVQAEWDALIAAAQAEGEVALVFAGSAGRNYGVVAEAFGERFGIKTVVSTGSGSSLVDQVLGLGRFRVDVVLVSLNHANRMVLGSALDPIADLFIHPQVMDASLWFGGQHRYADEAQQYVFTFSANARAAQSIWYNTDLVSQEDLDAINSVYDYLAPKFNGKIVALSPLASGASTPYYEAYVHPEIGPTWIDRFMSPELDVTFLEDYRAIVDGIRQGAFHFGIAIGRAGDDLDELAELGAPVQRFPCAVASVCTLELNEAGVLASRAGQNNIMVVNSRPHPNAAKLFVNWFLSREGQTVMHTSSEGTPDQTLRADVNDPGKTLPSNRRILDHGYYLLSSDPSFTSQTEEALQYAKDAFNATH